MTRAQLGKYRSGFPGEKTLRLVNYRGPRLEDPVGLKTLDRDGDDFSMDLIDCRPQFARGNHTIAQERIYILSAA